MLKRLTIRSAAVLACALAAVALAQAQVVGLQPTPIGMYTWNSGTGQWQAVASSSTAEPLANTPQAYAFYSYNAALAQWVPCTSIASCFGINAGTVTSFAAPSGSWPSWLTPTVTNPTTTPSLAVAASAIPNAALAVQTANTVLGALTATTPSGLAMPSCSATDDALNWTSGTGFGCSTITGVALEVNGTPNGSQTLLNLVAGSHVTLTDNGSGSVTIAATASSVGTGAVPEVPWYSTTSGVQGDPNLLDFSQSAVSLGASYALTGNITEDAYCHIGITLTSPPTLPGGANGVFVTLSNLPSDYSYLDGIAVPYISQSGGVWTVFDVKLQNTIGTACSATSQAAASATAAVTASYSSNGPVYSLAYLNYAGSGATFSNAAGQDYNWVALSPESSTSNGTESFNFYGANTNALPGGANYTISLSATGNDDERYSANYQFSSVSESEFSGNYGATLNAGAHIDSGNFLWETADAGSSYGPFANFYFGSNVAPPFSGDASENSFEVNLLTEAGTTSASYPAAGFDVTLNAVNSGGFNNRAGSNDVNFALGGVSNGTDNATAHVDEFDVTTSGISQVYAGTSGDYIGNINLSTSVTTPDGATAPHSGNLIISLSNTTSSTGGSYFATATGTYGWSSLNSALTAAGALTVASCTGCAPTLSALTMNNSGSGAASGTTFNGSAAETISYNTIGASPLAGSTSLTTLGTVTTGTWNATAISPAYGGTGANNSSATGVSQWSSGAQSVSTALANGTTATTQAAGDASTDVATDAFVQQATAVPAWLQMLGPGTDGAETCNGNLTGEFYYTTFNVPLGDTCTITNNGLTIHATGACTINGTIIGQGLTSGFPLGGGGAGGSGGGTAAATGSTSAYVIPSTGASVASAAGTAGVASGGNGGNAGLSTSTLAQREIFDSGAGADGQGFGGGKSGVGGSSGGASAPGGGGLTLICGSITGTGTINVSGANGNNAPGNNTGASAGGGGGVVILSSQAAETFALTINVAAGSPGSCGSYTGCGTPGTSAAGWYMEVSGW